jgi:protein-serine/threonine kinase
VRGTSGENQQESRRKPPHESLTTMANNGPNLYMNFENGNDRYATSDRSAFPTTPSTFPQPVFPGLPSQNKQQNAQQSGINGGVQASSQQQPQSQQYLGGGYGQANGGGGYFSQAQYPPTYGVQSASTTDYTQGNGTIGQATSLYAPARSNTPGTTSNDPNTGLAHQFSHQNLGGASRSNAAYNGRGPSPSRRPRTAGAAGQQTSYSYLNQPLPPQPPVQDFQTAPERWDDDRLKRSVVAYSNSKKCTQLSGDFFKDSVKRARERNQR